MSKKIKKLTPFLGQILQKIAPQIGAKVILEPKWKFVGQIIFKNGRKQYFRNLGFGFNSLAASEIAQDKDYSNFFMESMGYSVVPSSQAFFRNDWAKTIGQPARNIDAAYRYAQKIGFPVFVKPNSGSQGLDVSLVYNKQEFQRAILAVFKHDRIALVQHQVKGKEYRLVVLGEKVIWAYQCQPFNVVGDGKLNVFQLLNEKRKQFMLSNRKIKISFSDPRIKEKLGHYKMNFKSVPAKGQKIYLLDNANLSTGGDSQDVTKAIHPGFKKLAVKLAADMGLQFCGIDLVVQGSISEKPGKYWVLEVNHSPGLDHYPQTGLAQPKAAESLYLGIIKYMEKNNN
ncbi:MAG TPA: hypothetical protein VLK22_01725 [Candidatus Udaeobacter sp.]|nr:hypothetical protein [Candidatus Udaeobacter sp.]